MKEEWYADKRDVVKWGTLVFLARRHGIRAILQVAMFRRTTCGAGPLLLNGEPQPMPGEVWTHFRRLQSIEGLSALTGLKIDVFDRPFEWRQGFATKLAYRDDYFARVAHRIQSEDESLLVLLDPDTGLSPQNLEWEHVASQEVSSTYAAMKPGNVLAVYQHQYREQGWSADTRERIAHCCGVQAKDVDAFTSNYATDVALFCITKPQANYS